MKVGSLFAGIGGFDLGLERAGFTTAWFCEQDEFCQRVLAKHWPGVPCYPDICELKGSEVEPVDVLAGGFPCQDLSYAGRGAGIEGERSGLWSQYARLIGELRPRYVFVENVPALLTRGLGRVLGDLAALGYDAEWDCIPACALGAPHRRDRIWLVAYADSPSGQARASNRLGTVKAGVTGSSSGSRVAHGKRAMANAKRERPPRSRKSEQPVSSTKGSQGQATELEHGRVGSVWAVEPNVGRVADGVPARVDRLRSLGNALVPQVAEWVGCRIQEWEEE